MSGQARLRLLPFQSRIRTRDRIRVRLKLKHQLRRWTRRRLLIVFQHSIALIVLRSGVEYHRWGGTHIKLGGFIFQLHVVFLQGEAMGIRIRGCKASARHYLRVGQ